MSDTPNLPPFPFMLRAYCKDTQHQVESYALAAYQAGREAALDDVLSCIATTKGNISDACVIGQEAHDAGMNTLGYLKMAVEALKSDAKGGV